MVVVVVVYWPLGSKQIGMYQCTNVPIQAPVMVRGFPCEFLIMGPAAAGLDCIRWTACSMWWNEVKATADNDHSHEATNSWKTCPHHWLSVHSSWYQFQYKDCLCRYRVSYDKIKQLWSSLIFIMWLPMLEKISIYWNGPIIWSVNLPTQRIINSPGQNGRHFGRRHFQMHFLEWKW